MTQEHTPTITPEQKLQLIGLSAMAKELEKQQDLLLKSAAAITREDDPRMGHTSDYLFGGRDLEELIKLTEQFRKGKK